MFMQLAQQLVTLAQQHVARLTVPKEKDSSKGWSLVLRADNRINLETLLVHCIYLFSLCTVNYNFYNILILGKFKLLYVCTKIWPHKLSIRALGTCGALYCLKRMRDEFESVWWRSGRTFGAIAFTRSFQIPIRCSEVFPIKLKITEYNRLAIIYTLSICRLDGYLVKTHRIFLEVILQVY